MAKKMKRNKSNVKEVSDNIDVKPVSKNKKQKGKDENKQKLGIAKDKNLKFKHRLNKNAQKFSNKVLQIHKTEGNLVNSNIVKVTNVKSKAQSEKSDNSVKNKKKQQKDNAAKVINTRSKEQRKKSEYSANNKKKQEKLDATKIRNVQNSDYSAKTVKNKQKLNMNKNKQVKRAHDQSPNRPNKKNNATKQSMKKRNNPLPNANEIEDSKFTKQKKKKKRNADNGTAKLKSVLQKKKKQGKRMQSPMSSPERSDNSVTKRHKLDVKKIEEMLAVKQKETKKEKRNTDDLPLRERMLTKLRASRFRYLNQTLYNSESVESRKLFKDDPDAFKAYHEGYKQQVEQWPVNPLDVIISSIKRMPKEYIIADFGCGEARLAASVTHKVHSFDFVSLNDNVTVCDMAHTPLLTNGVHVVVFCLSLMGTNLKDYIVEANRVLKKDGILKIAEVESRFEQVEDFIKLLSEYGFKNTWKDLSHNLFHFLDFKKEKDIGNKKNRLPPITLKPCLYKKR